MTDDELAMAYADDALDAIAAKRFEQRIAQEPALAEAVAAHRRLRERLNGVFGGIVDEPAPDRLANLLRGDVIPMHPRLRRIPVAAWTAGAMAAGLALGVFIAGLDSGPIAMSKGQLLASGDLEAGLNTQLSGEEGSLHVLVSFRDSDGSYCRVFRTQPLDGIACRGRAGWVLRQTRTSVASGQPHAYRQAGSVDAALLAAAQNMMAGDPLDQAGELKARGRGWK